MKTKWQRGDAEALPTVAGNADLSPLIRLGERLTPERRRFLAVDRRGGAHRSGRQGAGAPGTAQCIF